MWPLKHRRPDIPAEFWKARMVHSVGYLAFRPNFSTLVRPPAAEFRCQAQIQRVVCHHAATLLAKT
jgi:hypothetical protein